jgi:flagellar biosynthesis/type III secretory pathway M-ring protein FliF/YscJ
MAPDDKREKELISKIREIVISQPERVAAVVKMWLEEEV